jgi:hypothetical protein
MHDIIKINKAKEIDTYIKRETEDKMFASLYKTFSMSKK